MKTHEKAYVCNLCTKKFSTETVLNKHINTKHNVAFLEENLEIFVEYE